MVEKGYRGWVWGRINTYNGICSCFCNLFAILTYTMALNTSESFFNATFCENIFWLWCFLKSPGELSFNILWVN